jgi:transcriptional regulator with XRE-family HTH domain
MGHPSADRLRTRPMDRPQGRLDRRYALTSFRVGNDWDYEAFRDYVLAAAAQVPGVTTLADINRITGIGQSSLSKWFNGREQPSDKNLRLLQAGFAEHGVQVNLRDLAQLAGRLTYDDGAEIAAPVVTFGDPLAREIDQMLADESPLAVEDKDAIRALLDRLIDPYRRRMRRRRSA